MDPVELLRNYPIPPLGAAAVTRDELERGIEFFRRSGCPLRRNALPPTFVEEMRRVFTARYAAKFAPGARIGDCLLVDYRLLHGGTANRGNNLRSIVYLIYSRPWFGDYRNCKLQRSNIQNRIAEDSGPISTPVCVGAREWLSRAPVARPSPALTMTGAGARVDG